MSRIDVLQKLVASLYNSDHPGRADWADWLYDNHVLVVAKEAERLAKKYDANSELAVAASLLHDIADATMKREDPNHATESLAIARRLMAESGFSEAEIALTVDDAIRFHSCHGDERPHSLEGKILATADSFAHLKTDFYIFATNQLGMTVDEIKNWTLKKIERDITTKCFFEDERNVLTPDYTLIKELFSR